MLTLDFEGVEPIYEGKSKAVYPWPADLDLVMIRFKDDATAFNGEKHEVLPGKGGLNCEFNCVMMDLLDQPFLIDHHMVARLTDDTILCKKVDIIPVEVVVRNKAAGSIVKRYQLEEGKPFPEPVIELFYKSDDLNDPLVGEDAAVKMHWCDSIDLMAMKQAALAINAQLKAFWGSYNIDLVDFKLEFGLDKDGKLLLADEITPDGCRLGP